MLECIKGPMNQRIIDLESIRLEMATLLDDFGNIVVAGGAVRDALMDKDFKDVDVFVLSQGHGDTWSEVAGLIRPRLQRFQTIKPKVEWHKSEPFLIETIKHPAGEVQVMLRNLSTTAELLDTFDWNVSLFAIDDTLITCREDIGNIKPGGELWVQKVTYPRSTLRRGFRFSERFHMKFRPGHMEAVCASVAAGQLHRNLKQ